jgi:hypothetical protein
MKMKAKTTSSATCCQADDLFGRCRYMATWDPPCREWPFARMSVAQPPGVSGPAPAVIGCPY